MPEGVECLITAESIQKWAYDQDIEKKGYVNFNIDYIYDKSICRMSPIPINLWNNYLGKLYYRNITTFGKNIFLPFENSKCCIQLGMTGLFSLKQSSYSRLKFISDFMPLYYEDMRKFGKIMVYTEDNPPRNISFLLRKSIEWRNKLAPSLFVKRCKKRKKWTNSTIKNLLINQQVISGIGNVYSNEGLFEAEINPKRKIKDLSDNELYKVISSCQSFMNKSYSLGGISIFTFKNFENKEFSKKYLMVYNRDGLLCKRCKKAIIQKITIKNKASYYCPNCQL